MIGNTSAETGSAESDIHVPTSMDIIETGIISFVLSGVFWNTVGESARVGAPLDLSMAGFGTSLHLFNSIATALLLTALLLYVEL